MEYQKYFEEICPEDQDSILTICEMSSTELWEKFRMKFDDPKLLAVTWAKIYEAFLKKLVDLRKDCKNFEINVCDRFLMGFDTTDDEDMEKNGNFEPYIIHLDTNKRDDISIEPTDTAEDRAVQWNTNNILDQPKILREISAEALDILKSDVSVLLASSEMIMPVFIKTYESLIKYLKIKRRDEDKYEYELNWLSCFNIGCRDNEDNDGEIYINASIYSKLFLKDDATASSKYE